MSNSKVEISIEKVESYLKHIPTDIKLPLLKHLKKVIAKVTDMGAKGFDKLTDFISDHLSKAQPMMTPMIKTVEEGVDTVIMEGIHKAGQGTIGLILTLEDSLEAHNEIKIDHS